MQWGDEIANQKQECVGSAGISGGPGGIGGAASSLRGRRERSQVRGRGGGDGKTELEAAVSRSMLPLVASLASSPILHPLITSSLAEAKRHRKLHVDPKKSGSGI
jgi:hypothetical protein